MRAVFVTVLLAACGNDSVNVGPDAAPVAERDCDLPSTVAAYLGDEPFTDCGSVTDANGPDMATEQIWLAAKQCAIDSIATNAPFKVEWALSGDDTGEAFALVGTRDGVGLQLSTFAIYYPKDGCPVDSTRKVCTSVTDLGDCDDVFRNFCIRCEQVIETDTCEFVYETGPCAD